VHRKRVTNAARAIFSAAPKARLQDLPMIIGNILRDEGVLPQQAVSISQKRDAAVEFLLSA